MEPKSDPTTPREPANPAGSAASSPKPPEGGLRQPSRFGDAPASPKPWTIKGLSWEVRNAAIAAAEREGQTIGEWLARAILAQAQSDHQRGRMPVAVGPRSDLGSAPPTPLPELDEIERLVGLAGRYALASGAPPPRSVDRAAYGLIRDRLRCLRRHGPTAAPLGPTKVATQSDPQAS